MPKANEKLIKSKERVRDLAEVNTPRWVVQQMLNQPGVKECAEDVWKTFLEPACGDGNFLVAILKRKMRTFSKENPRCQRKTFEFALIGALTSIYGVDICQQNVEDAQKRMLRTAELCFRYHSLCGRKRWVISEELLRSAKAVVAQTIKQGNALTEQEHTVFTEYKPVKSGPANRSFFEEKFYLSDVLNGRDSTPAPRQDTPYQQSLFEDLTPRPVHYLKIGSPLSERWTS